MDTQAIISKIAEFNPQIASTIQENPNLLILIALQIIFKMIFYPWALYKSAERKQKTWFVLLFIGLIILNDFGVFAALYLVLNRKKDNYNFSSDVKVSKKKK